jgi:hypothetical protein
MVQLVPVACSAPPGRVTTGDQGEVFKPPKPYAQALQDKIARVARMRAALKTSSLDHQSKAEVQNVIQAYFKEWLRTTDNMREMHDLTRFERMYSREQARNHKERRRRARASGGDHSLDRGSAERHKAEAM